MKEALSIVHTITLHRRSRWASPDHNNNKETSQWAPHLRTIKVNANTTPQTPISPNPNGKRKRKRKSAFTLLRSSCHESESEISFSSKTLKSSANPRQERLLPFLIDFIELTIQLHQSGLSSL